MNILIIEIEVSMIHDNDIDIEMKKREYFINMSFMIDSLYNVIVCEKCGIGLSFE